MTLKHNLPTNDLSQQWDWLLQTWLQEKQTARKTQNWQSYQQFLHDVKKELSRCYAGFTHETWINLCDEVFRLLACELQEIVIKSNNTVMAPKKPALTTITDTQLLESYTKGTQWLLAHQQLPGTTLTESGEPYQEALWHTALTRIEKLEQELQRRGIAY